MENQHSPSDGYRPPNRYDLIPLNSRLARCAGALDCIAGYIDALGDVIAQAADAYDGKLTSRLYLTSQAAEELEEVSNALTSIQISFLVWQRADGERASEKKRKRRR